MNSQMQNEYLLTKNFSHEGTRIIQAINARAQEIRKQRCEISTFRKVTLLITKPLTVVAGISGLGMSFFAAFTGALEPALFGLASLAIAVTSLACHLFFDIRSGKEAYVKDLWKQLFDAIKTGKAETILTLCAALDRQKEEDPQQFTQVLGSLDGQAAAIFIQKARFLANLLHALDLLDRDNFHEAKSHAHIALSMTQEGQLPAEAEQCATAIITTPDLLKYTLQQCGLPQTVQELDGFITLISHKE